MQRVLADLARDQAMTRRRKTVVEEQPVLELEDWQRITVPKPGPAARQALKPLAHATCVDHVRVDGLSSPVCILRGQDRAQIVDIARELAGLDR